MSNIIPFRQRPRPVPTFDSVMRKLANAYVATEHMDYAAELAEIAALWQAAGDEWCTPPDQELRP
jgi:hypothetical protein